MKKYIVSDYTEITIKLPESNDYKYNIEEILGKPIKSSTGEIIGKITGLSDKCIYGKIKTESFEFKDLKTQLSIKDIPKSVESYNKLINFEDE